MSTRIAQRPQGREVRERRGERHRRACEGRERQADERASSRGGRHRRCGPGEPDGQKSHDASPEGRLEQPRDGEEGARGRPAPPAGATRVARGRDEREGPYQAYGAEALGLRRVPVLRAHLDVRREHPCPKAEASVSALFRNVAAQANGDCRPAQGLDDPYRVRRAAEDRARERKREVDGRRLEVPRVSVRRLPADNRPPDDGEDSLVAAISIRKQVGEEKKQKDDADADGCARELGDRRARQRSPAERGGYERPAHDTGTAG